MVKKFDFILYLIIFCLMGVVLHAAMTQKTVKAENVEIFVNNKLEYTYKLSEERRVIEIPTDIGGVILEFEEKKVRVTRSYSPRKLVVKQGWISKSGETLIGVPDKLLVKITGDREDGVDVILR